MSRRKRLTTEDVRTQLIKACEAAGNQAAWARAHGLSVPYVNDVIRRRRDPGKAICDALGLEKIVTYQPKGD